jgi:hypothetical protein
MQGGLQKWPDGHDSHMVGWIQRRWREFGESAPWRHFEQRYNPHQQNERSRITIIYVSHPLLFSGA